MSLWILILLVLSLFANIILVVMLRNQGAITGFATKTEERVLFEHDVVEINKADLTQCCSFINADGEEDSCYALKDYACTYCQEYCD